MKCYVGLIEQVLQLEGKKGGRYNNGNANNSNQFRYYYLLYYFYQTVLEDPSGRYIPYFYESPTDDLRVFERLDVGIYRSVKELLYYLISDTN